MAWGNRMHRRSALALQRRSPSPALDVHRRLPPLDGPNGGQGGNGPPPGASFDPSLLGLPGVDLSATPATSVQVTTSSVATTNSPAIPVTTSAPRTTASNTTVAITHHVTPSTGASTSATASAKSAVASASSGSDPGSVAGGVTVGVIAFAALICIIVYFVRRSRRYGQGQFDASEFRRSAVLMSDPPTHEDTIARGFNPPPPMSERKHVGSPLSPHSDSHNNLTSGVGGNHAGFIIPTRALNPISTTPVPHSPSTFATAGHSSSSDQSSAPPSTFVTRQQSSPRRASRPASGNDPGAANGFTFPRRQNSTPNTPASEKRRPPQLNLGPPPIDDYVDLSRSSVSPFQAAQYVEISKRLNSPVPHGLGKDLPEVNARTVVTPSLTETTEHSPDLPPLPPKSPFDDPESIRESVRASVRESYSSGQSISIRVRTPELQDFPVPPSPAPTATSRYRIESQPPVLPELNLDLGNSFGSNRRSLVPKYQYQPSPLASSAVTTGEAAHEEDSKGESATTTLPQTGTPEKSPTVKRPETVYDPSDAYGGI